MIGYSLEQGCTPISKFRFRAIAVHKCRSDRYAVRIHSESSVQLVVCIRICTQKISNMTADDARLINLSMLSRALDAQVLSSDVISFGIPFSTQI